MGDDIKLFKTNTFKPGDCGHFCEACARRDDEIKRLREILCSDLTTEWLLGRESDISSGWEDLGGLRGFFKTVIGREPKD